MVASRLSAARRAAKGLERRAARARRAARGLRWGPTLTVVVAGSGAAETTRQSLAVQTAHRRRYEVVEVTGTSPVAALVTRGAAARGTHVVVIAAGDTVSPTALAGVLELLDPDVAVCVPVDPGPHPAPKLDLVGLTDAMRTVRGVALPIASLRGTTGTGSEPLFLARTLIAAGVRLVRCSPASGATYHRSNADDSTDVDAAFADLERVAALPRTHGQPVVEAALRAATAPLNRALRADPGLRSSLEDRAAGVAGFDYGSLNRGMARDLAILYAALPFSDTAANIAARRVRAAGVLVDVVSADLSKRRATDPSADPLWERLLDEHVRLGGRAGVQGEWDSAARFCHDGYAQITQWDEAKGPYRTVYSRTMFPASHLLAARYKLARPDTVWTAEFSDPQVRDSRGGTRRSKGDADAALLTELGAGMRAHGFEPPAGDSVWEWAEALAYALADTVLFTNAAQRDYMLGYCPSPALAERAREHTEVSVHPSPPAEFYAAPGPDYPLEPGCVHIAYFGTFYPTRTLTEVVTAFAALAPETRARLRLHVFTTKPDVLRTEVEAAGLGDVFVVNGYVPFADYLALTTRFDVLLVNDFATVGNHDVNPYLPAKYADYRGSGTDVWGIVEPGSVLSGLPLAHRSDLGDVEGAGQVLQHLVRSGAN